MRYFITCLLILSSLQTVHAQSYRVIDLQNDILHSLRIDGAEAGDKIGLSVATGDINGDGLSDMVIGANEADNGRGAVYVVMGAANLRHNAGIDIGNWNAPVIAIKGAAEGDQLGNWVDCCDVDGDGYQDLILPALYGDTAYGRDTGKVYVLGGSADFPRERIFTVDRYNGKLLEIHGIYQRGTLGFIDSSGDLNGDGYADIILKSHLADPLGRVDAGATFVVFGKPGYFNRNVIYLTPWDSDGVLTVIGSGSYEEYDWVNRETQGWSTGAGDLNGDGCDELIIGSHNADPFGLAAAGSVHIIPGSPAIDSYHVIDLLMPDVKMISIHGEHEGDNFGNIVLSEDVDGDGCDDLAVNALYGDAPGVRNTGKIYVLFGSSDFCDMNTIPLSYSDNPMITVSGYRSGDALGPMGFGDMNGDGHPDLIAGMPFFDYHSIFDDREASGGAAILFGGDNIRNYGDIFVSDPNLHYIVSAHDNDTFGFRIATGDFNGDAVDDALIGAHGASPGERTIAGSCYIIWGNETWQFPGVAHTSLAVQSENPATLRLDENYPNPFNPTTNISFHLPEETKVTLSIFNILGSKIETIEDTTLPAGEFVYTWDATPYSSGRYFYRLQTASGVLTKQMTLIK